MINDQIIKSKHDCDYLYTFIPKREVFNSFSFAVVGSLQRAAKYQIQGRIIFITIS